MNLEWKRVTGDFRPPVIDDQSSPTSVYLHRNIEEVEVPGDMMREGEDPRTQWVFDEIILLNEDFEKLKAENKTFREGLKKGEIEGI